jgi:hypothetical protein
VILRLPLRHGIKVEWLRIRRPRWQRQALKTTHVHDLLYVASDLSTVVIPASDALWHRRRLDLLQDGVGFRYLDARWYAWLYQRVLLAQRLCSHGQMPADALEVIHARWDAIDVWATDHIPEQLRHRAATWDPGPDYRLPGRAA